MGDSVMRGAASAPARAAESGGAESDEDAPERQTAPRRVRPNKRILVDATTQSLVFIAICGVGVLASAWALVDFASLVSFLRATTWQILHAWAAIGVASPLLLFCPRLAGVVVSKLLRLVSYLPPMEMKALHANLWLQDSSLFVRLSASHITFPNPPAFPSPTLLHIHTFSLTLSSSFPTLTTLVKHALSLRGLPEASTGGYLGLLRVRHLDVWGVRLCVEGGKLEGHEGRVLNLLEAVSALGKRRLAGQLRRAMNEWNHCHSNPHHSNPHDGNSSDNAESNRMDVANEAGGSGGVFRTRRSASAPGTLVANALSRLESSPPSPHEPDHPSWLSRLAWWQSMWTNPRWPSVLVVTIRSVIGVRARTGVRVVVCVRGQRGVVTCFPTPVGRERAQSECPAVQRHDHVVVGQANEAPTPGTPEGGSEGEDDPPNIPPAPLLPTGTGRAHRQRWLPTLEFTVDDPTALARIVVCDQHGGIVGQWFLSIGALIAGPHRCRCNAVFVHSPGVLDGSFPLVDKRLGREGQLGSVHARLEWKGAPEGDGDGEGETSQEECTPQSQPRQSQPAQVRSLVPPRRLHAGGRLGRIGGAVSGLLRKAKEGGGERGEGEGGEGSLPRDDSLHGGSASDEGACTPSPLPSPPRSPEPDFLPPALADHSRAPSESSAGLPVVTLGPPTTRVRSVSRALSLREQLEVFLMELWFRRGGSRRIRDSLSNFPLLFGVDRVTIGNVEVEVEDLFGECDDVCGVRPDVSAKRRSVELSFAQATHQFRPNNAPGLSLWEAVNGLWKHCLFPHLSPPFQAAMLAAMASCAAGACQGVADKLLFLQYRLASEPSLLHPRVAWRLGRIGPLQPEHGVSFHEGFLGAPSDPLERARQKSLLAQLHSRTYFQPVRLKGLLVLGTSTVHENPRHTTPSPSLSSPSHHQPALVVPLEWILCVAELRGQTLFLTPLHSLSDTPCSAGPTIAVNGDRGKLRIDLRVVPHLQLLYSAPPSPSPSSPRVSPSCSTPHITPPSPPLSRRSRVGSDRGPRNTLERSPSSSPTFEISLQLPPEIGGVCRLTTPSFSPSPPIEEWYERLFECTPRQLHPSTPLAKRRGSRRERWVHAMASRKASSSSAGSVGEGGEGVEDDEALVVQGADESHSPSCLEFTRLYDAALRSFHLKQFGNAKQQLVDCLQFAAAPAQVKALQQAITRCCFEEEWRAGEAALQGGRLGECEKLLQGALLLGAGAPARSRKHVQALLDQCVRAQQL